MVGLQKRISTLFLQLMEDRKFNPASKRLQPGQGFTMQMKSGLSL